MNATPAQLTLGFAMDFRELYAREGLLKLDAAFVQFLGGADAPLADALHAARANMPAAKDASDLLTKIAPHLEDFIAQLFGIGSDVRTLAESHHALAPLYACKRLFVQRRALKALNAEQAKAVDAEALRQQLTQAMGEAFSEIAYARAVMRWLEDESAHASALEAAAQYAAWAMLTDAGRAHHRASVLFHQPHKIDPQHLVATQVHDGKLCGLLETQRVRDGFALTDAGADLQTSLSHAHYCIFCHHQGRDSCSKGLKEKDGAFKRSAGEVPLAGCPLEEHISEMNELKAGGVPVGALAVAMVANPMLAGTGHRICNDCMKACIYQKQEPVDIPQVETRTLKDVLALPWGFEIYSLLSRWNPLDFVRAYPKQASGKRVLVVGMGPAGYTLSHHLMNDGHEVFAIDGLKIEPLPAGLADADFAPIRDASALDEDLDARTLAGFGGVAEYGITVRWNKNFLKIIRLLLERRTSQFALAGGVRFGGTLTIEQAWQMGFDHIALCMGAGKPTVIDMPNALARGVRTASDFLMALQLTGAAKRDSIANLQVRLPVVVIGGGLTAIDTATEALAYYPVQVEKFLSRYEALCASRGEDVVRQRWNAEEQQIADEFIAHAHALRAVKPEDRVARLQGWGGVTIAYRKELQDAPSYRLNHEEVAKALEEGISIAPNLSPKAVDVDAHGHASAVRFTNGANGEEITLPARTVLMAAGTSPNITLQHEAPEQIELDGRYFCAVDVQGNPVKPERSAKPEVAQMLTHVEKDGRAISFFGDLHPSFAGNVVKAMASAKQGYPLVSRMLSAQSSSAKKPTLAEMKLQLSARVVAVNRLTPTIVEVVLHAPMAAQNFRPGQFYRLQNYEAYAALAMEGLAMTGAWVDKAKGQIAIIALEMGGSSDLCAVLKKDEPVVLMGPTGEPTEIPAGETLLLVGGGLGNAVLFSIGREARAKGGKVLYFAGYKKTQDRYKVEEIEAASDVVVWCCDEVSDFTPNRPQDKMFHGNIVQAMAAYGAGELGEAAIPMNAADRLIAIGSDRMMHAVGVARHGVLKPYLKPGHVAIGSINSPMQCMMKEICAQCLQRHVDPDTGKESYVYSCMNQDQRLDVVDFQNLAVRLRQNSVQEKLTALLVDECLKNQGLSKST